MAQFDLTKKLNLGNGQETPLQIETAAQTDVMTGDRNRGRFLYYQLKMSMQKAVCIDIIVSFLMESGVKMILKDLQAALDRGVQMRILTGNYLGITQPSALLAEIVQNNAFKRQMKDILEYRTMAYYRRRYAGESD